MDLDPPRQQHGAEHDGVDEQADADDPHGRGGRQATPDDDGPGGVQERRRQHRDDPPAVPHDAIRPRRHRETHSPQSEQEADELTQVGPIGA